MSSSQGRALNTPHNEKDSSQEEASISPAAEATSSSTQQMHEETVQEKKQEEEHQPPNGGLEAWLRVLAGFFVFVNTWGITATFGAFQAFYTADLLSSKSSSAISWVGSIQSFLVVIVGIIAGPLFDMGYLRPVMFLGFFLLVLGMMMLSLAKSYYQVFLAQGICVGLGAGLIYVPALALISTQFTTKRPIAIGCASAGSSIGGIIFPIMFRRLQPQVGFGWAVRSIAFVNLGLSAVALAILGRHRGTAPKNRRVLVDLSAFGEPPFAFFAAALLFIFVGFYIPLFYIPSYAKSSLQTSDDFAFYLLAITNAASFFGRTVPFLLAQRLGSIQIFLFWATVGIIVLFAWIGIHNVPGFVVFCVLWGFTSGVLVTAPAVAVAHPVLSPSLSVIGTRLGMSWSTAAVGILIGTPIAGALADVRTAHFVHAQGFAGAMMAAGALCLVWPLVAILRSKSPKAATA